MELKKPMTGLPPWNELTNETIPTLNTFNMFRGKKFIKMGDDVWIGYYTLIDGSGGLEIGNKVSISSGVHIYTHDSSKFRAYDLEKDTENGSHIRRAPVKIGSNVQIGANSIITKGVTIGNNVIVGALTLVNKDIPDNSFVTGNPMVIKKLDNDYK
jgi:acetyltransferase-like isoleucine patch superfamily enzyme